MVRKSGLTAGFFAAGVVCLLATTTGVNGADGKFASIDTIMNKSFNKKKGAVATLPAAVKAEKWDEAKKIADGLAKFAADLGKNKPPKGSADSWKKLCEEFAAQAKGVSDAVAKKDAKAVTDAMAKFTAQTNCKACHEAHQE